MARIASAAIIKASARGAKKTGLRAHPQESPRPGSKLRDLFDLLHANKGVEVEPSMYFSPQTSHNGIWTAMRQLEDTYGLDVRIRHSGQYGVPPRLMLVGEWIGMGYVDYMADKTHDEIRPLVPIDIPGPRP